MAADEATIPAGDLPTSHPRGLQTLFFTEMWERMSYYGMRALLVLFMVDAVQTGGLGFTDEKATAIYGLYTAAVYLVALPGGWIADRLLGAQRSIWYGGIVIMCGHFVLAIPSLYTFFVGLLLIVLGTGLLKPNISAVVGELYGPGDPRRDAGFTIYYMGINIGAAIGPLVCSTLGESERFGWHWGFAAAGVGMLLGLIQFRLTAYRLGKSGLEPSLDRNNPDDREKMHKAWRFVGASLVLIVIGLALLLSETVTVDPQRLAENAATIIAAVAGLYFAALFAFGHLTTMEKKRVGVIIILFISSAMFWSGFEQAGSSLNLFAERYTDRMIGAFEIPAGWYQSLNPAFIIVLAPAYSALWIGLARRNLDPSTPVKFAIGILLLALGFLIMYGAALLVIKGNQVMPTWLFFTYLLHTMGELALSPVGLSATTKLAPHRFVGQMMGVWFLGASLGNILAGLLAGEFSGEAVSDFPGLYLQIVLTLSGFALLLLALSRPIRRLMGPVDEYPRVRFPVAMAARQQLQWRIDSPSDENNRSNNMSAYLLAVCEVTDPNENFKKYAVESAKLLQQHGGEYLVRGGAAEVLKGDVLKGKVVILSVFPDMETLLGFVNDPVYVNEISPLRDGTGIYDFACYESIPPAPGS